VAQVSVLLIEALKRRGQRVPAGPVKCPGWLGDMARKEWKRVAPELVQCGLVCSLDAFMLAVYCNIVASVDECQAVIRRDGEQITHWDDDGTTRLMPHPAIAQAQEAAAQAVTFAAEFGLPARSDGRMILPSEMGVISDG